MTDTQLEDTVRFQGINFSVPNGHSEEDIRLALEEQAPAIAHAQVTKTANADGSFTWSFAERAGTKGL